MCILVPMNTIYRFGYGLSIFLFGVLLFVVGLLAALVVVFGGPERAKDSLAESGAYAAFVEDALDNESSLTARGVPVDDPQIRALFVDNLSPSLRADIHAGMDDLYAWLQGEQQSASLTIDFAEASEPILDGVEAHVAEHISGLPVCADFTPAFVLNPYELECLPQGLDTSEVAHGIRLEVSSQLGRWSDTITFADSNEDEQSAPGVYRAVTTSFWILLGAALAAGVAAVLLAGKLYSGLRSVGTVSLTVGVLLALIALGASVLVANLSADMAEGASNALEHAVPELVRGLGGALYTSWLWSGVALVAAGISLVVTATIATRRQR